MKTTLSAEMAARILIVEDDPANAYVFQTFCRLGGHAPSWAPSCREALEVLAEEDIDLVLLDVQLPGEDGRVIARALRGAEATMSVPIVIVTAMAEGDALDELRDLGVEEILLKPFSGNALRTLLGRLLSPG